MTSLPNWVLPSPPANLNSSMLITNSAFSWSANNEVDVKLNYAMFNNKIHSCTCKNQGDNFNNDSTIWSARCRQIKLFWKFRQSFYPWDLAHCAQKVRSRLRRDIEKETGEKGDPLYDPYLKCISDCIMQIAVPLSKYAGACVLKTCTYPLNMIHIEYLHLERETWVTSNNFLLLYLSAYHMYLPISWSWL